MKKSLLALTLIAALPFAAANAQDRPNYNYAQGGYTSLDGDDDVDADGYNLEGSVAVAPNWHIFAGTQQLKDKDYDIGVDEWKIGVGFNHAISANTDFVARGAYQKLKTDDIYVGGLKLANGADLDGYSVEAGVRSNLAPNFEGYAMAGYEKYGDNDGYEGPKGAYGRLGGQVKFNPNWGVFGDVKFGDGDAVWSVGPRISW